MKLTLVFAFCCGLLAFAAAYPSSPARAAPGAVKLMQSDTCAGGPGVLLDFFLGFTTVSFRVCRFPTACLLVEEICPNDRQLTPLGSFVPVFLSSSQFHTVQLFGGFSGFCLRANPPLPSCFDDHLPGAAAAKSQASHQEENKPMKVCTTDEATGEEHCYMMEQHEQPQEVCVYYEETGKKRCYPLGTPAAPEGQAQESTKNINDLMNSLNKEIRY